MQVLKKLIKKYGSHFLYQQQLKRQTYLNLLEEISKADGLPLSNASGNIFTYHGEDGIIQFILKYLGNVPTSFIDIGSGDCIKSNCAVLAVHQNWNGIFIDADKNQLSIGRRFYRRLDITNLHFKEAYVTPININALIKELSYTGKVGLLSIDIDGNDYWIWDALEIVQPFVVVIEAKVEYGTKSIAVPYSEKNHHSYDRMYNGASVEALRKKGLEKGYTLIGANVQGYNLFFIPTHYVKPPFYPVKTESLLQHPETQKSFYEESFFRSREFVTV